MRLSRGSRKIVFGAQYISFGRVKNTAKVLNQDFMESLLEKSKFLEKAPFEWVHLTFLFGEENNLEVAYQGIDPEYNDLQTSVELNVAVLQWADNNSQKLLHDIFVIASLEALMQIGRKYDLPIEMIQEEHTNFLSIPKDVEACKFYCGPVG